MSNSYICAPGLDTFETMPRATTYRNPADWFVQSLTNSSSKIVVNETTVLMHGPVWRALNLLAGDIGQLPVHVMRRNGRGTEKDRKHPASKLLRGKPNGWQTASVWKETLIYYAIIYGNAVCWIRRDGANRPVSLVPWHPKQVAPSIVEGELMFQLYNADRKLVSTIHNQDALHITGLRSDGFWGFSLLEIAAKDLGLGIALRDHGREWFENGASPGGVLMHPDRLESEARDNLRREWSKIHSGPKNSGKVAILWEGMTYEQMAISNDDSQWLDSRKFDRETVANWFGVPAFKLNEMSNSSVRANLEEQNRDYYQTSLSRWTNRMREEFDCKLLSFKEQETESHFHRWFPEAFLRGDTQTRFDAYSTAIASRFMSPNEVREREDLNPYEGGDEYLNPNIDTTADEGESDEGEPEGDLRQSVSELIRGRCRHLVKAESRCIRQAAKSTKNFLKWLDGFYEDKWEPMAHDILGDSIRVARAAGHSVHSDPLANHANTSRDHILEIAGTSSRETLAENVADLVEGWETERADELATSITGQDK